MNSLPTVWPCGWWFRTSKRWMPTRTWTVMGRQLSIFFFFPLEATEHFIWKHSCEYFGRPFRDFLNILEAMVGVVNVSTHPITILSRACPSIGGGKCFRLAFLERGKKTFAAHLFRTIGFWTSTRMFMWWWDGDYVDIAQCSSWKLTVVGHFQFAIISSLLCIAGLQFSQVRCNALHVYARFSDGPQLNHFRFHRITGEMCRTYLKHSKQYPNQKKMKRILFSTGFFLFRSNCGSMRLLIFKGTLVGIQFDKLQQLTR